MQTTGRSAASSARHRRGTDLHTRLQLLEAGTAFVVERNDFAVEHHVGLREGISEGSQLREARRGVVAEARGERELTRLDHEDHPHAVPLHLERPVLFVRWQLLCRGREHRAEVTRHRLAGGVGGRAHAVDHPLIALGLEQGVLAVDPFAVQRDDDLVVAQLLGLVRAGVPDRHRAGPVLALRDVAVEREVLERVIFGAYREVVRLVPQRDALRNRPRPEHAVVFEPQIPVETTRVVLLHDEARLTRCDAISVVRARVRACSRSRASCGTPGAVPSPGAPCSVRPRRKLVRAVAGQRVEARGVDDRHGQDATRRAPAPPTGNRRH